MNEDFAITSPPDRVLQAYLLGAVNLDAVLRLQKRLVYEVTGNRANGMLVVCEHHHAISIGREGSREHVGYNSAELSEREWPLRWVNRGGGVLLHAPGQIAIYPIFALDALKLDLPTYLDRLYAILLETLAEFGISGQRRPQQSGIFVHQRMIAHVGVAVRDWVSYFGASLNAAPDMAPFRPVQCSLSDDPPMTSIQREARTPVRTSGVRLRLVEKFAAAFGFERTSLFHSHPGMQVQASNHALASNRR